MRSGSSLQTQHGVRQLGPQWLGEVMAHVVEHEQRGAGDDLRSALAAGQGDECVSAAMNDERRNVQRGSDSPREGVAMIAAYWRVAPSGWNARS